jgi:hypothetical protein
MSNNDILFILEEVINNLRLDGVSLEDDGVKDEDASFVGDLDDGEKVE